MSDSLVPVLLCLFSAVTVATANFAVKRGGDVLSARMVLSITSSLCVLPFAFVVPLPDRELWVALGVATAAHWVYQFCMIRALHRGDLSLVFPVMRGLAPMMTALVAVMALNEFPGLFGWIGLSLATLALIVFALPERSETGQRTINSAALFWAVMTSAGIGLYSVTDAYGVRIADQRFSFIVWLFLLDWIGITAVSLWTRRGQLSVRLRPQLLGGMVGGVANVLSYGSALVAFSLTHAATVTAIRETSVVFGAILGAVFLKEGFGKRRIVAASVLAAGLLLLETDI
ncbi:DMT family transporter [Henriciella aquimarina]|uniref:DMT family transporter n=1 Tax=Henriciella aquimarina TaxID=545261 RepID=UPI000A006805|nr:DMT family transporter [Henriciella aquimarina]